MLSLVESFNQLEGLSRREALRRAQVRLRTIGAELQRLYQPQIDPLLERIIEKLKGELAGVQQERKELKKQQKLYTEETDEFKALLDKKLKEIVKQMTYVCHLGLIYLRKSP